MNTSSETSTLVAFLRYRGARLDHLGLDNSSLTYAVDVGLIGILAVMVYRNLFVVPHNLVWLLLGALTAHLGLLVLRPKHLSHWRVVVIAINALVIAMAVPLKLEANVFITAYIACLGCLALFFAMGTTWSISAAVIYTGYVAFMMTDPRFGFAQTGYNIMMLSGLILVILAALLLLHHFMVKLEQTNLELQATGDYLQQSIDGLQYAAAAGSVGIWSYKTQEDQWNANGMFRDLIDLPADQYESLSSHLIKQRLPKQAAEDFIQRLRRPEDMEFEMIDILKQDGTRLPCQVMSKVYPNNDGGFIRRGVLVAIQPRVAEQTAMGDA